MRAVYGGGIVLLWVCALLLAGSEDSVSGVLRGSLKRNDGRRKKDGKGHNHSFAERRRGL